MAEKHHIDWFGPIRGPLLLFIIYVGFFWKLTLTSQFTWLDSPDFANQVLPWFQYAAGEFHAGHFPLWAPYEWAGQPLIGQMQPGVACLFNWILFSLPLDDGWIQQPYIHWYFVLLHYLGGLFCYWLCRDLKRSFSASIFAGAAFGIVGYMGNTDWPQMLNGALWAPLVFLFQFRALRGQRPIRNAAFSGACLGISFLSGHHQIPIFLTLATACFWGYFLIQDLRDSKRWKAAGAAALFLALIGAFQTLPALEYGKYAVRWTGASHVTGWRDIVPYSVHAEFSFFPMSMVGITVPGAQVHTIAFMGWTVVALALMGVAACWRNRSAKQLAYLALGGVLVALGQHGLVHGWLYSLVPLVEKARAPNTAIFFFNFASVVLSAYGLDAYYNSQFFSGAWVRRTIRALFAAGIVFFLLVLGFTLLHTPQTLGFNQVSVSGLAAILCAAILQLTRMGRLPAHTATGLFLLLMLFENANVAGYAYRNREQPPSLLARMSRDNDIVRFLGQQTGPLRVQVDDQEIPYNLGDWRGIDVFGGYLASLTTNIEATQGDGLMRMLFGVNYAIGKKPPLPDSRDVFTGASGLKVYLNPGAFPRVWSVHRVVGVSAGEEAAKINATGPALPSVAIVQGQPPPLESCGQPDTVLLLSRIGGLVRIEANMACKGMVIDADTWFPGWKAAVDGKPERIWEADAALRGVVVPAGRHHIEMVYRPNSVMLGAALSALGVLGLIGIVLFDRRRIQRIADEHHHPI